MASAKPKSPSPRKDPTPRFLGDMPFWDRLDNADPNRVYVWANPSLGVQSGGPDRFILMGYRVETVEPGGVRPAVTPRGLKEGDEIKIGDLLLMSVDREEWEAQRAHGQRKADALQERMIVNRGLDDPLRGMRSRYFSVASEISPLQRDRDFGGE